MLFNSILMKILNFEGGRSLKNRVNSYVYCDTVRSNIPSTGSESSQLKATGHQPGKADRANQAKALTGQTGQMS